VAKVLFIIDRDDIQMERFASPISQLTDVADIRSASTLYAPSKARNIV
jgi:hypothetical protein